MGTALAEAGITGGNAPCDNADSPGEGAEGLTYAALKGFSHYPCLRKIDRLAVEGPGMRLVAGKEQSQAPALAALLSYIEPVSYTHLDVYKRQAVDDVRR